jgi:hypothetical protein
MPRNPIKAPCQVPGCHSWAMRGTVRCRAHSDDALGSRAVGAPVGNLNALQHGDYLSPLPVDDLQSLAARIVQQPGELPEHIVALLRSIHARTGDPYLTLSALARFLPGLAAWVAALLFAAELRAYLDPLPPPVHRRVAALIDRQLDRCSPEQRLLIFRKIKRSRNN